MGILCAVIFLIFQASARKARVYFLIAIESCCSGLPHIKISSSRVVWDVSNDGKRTDAPCIDHNATTRDFQMTLRIAKTQKFTLELI